jgi:DNA-binding ferritin-like protein (Dps family)
MTASLKKMIREKAEYKASRALVEALPDDYKFVCREIEKYLFSISVDESMLPVLMNIIESCAVSAQNGRPVFSVITEDLGSFCDAMIERFRAKTWMGAQKEKMNKNIHKRFGIEPNRG